MIHCFPQTTCAREPNVLRKYDEKDELIKEMSFFFFT